MLLALVLYPQSVRQFLQVWYYLSKAVSLDLYKQLIASEIRYLVLTESSTQNPGYKEINKLWPVKNISLLPRSEITEDQAGSKSSSSGLYYLFELAKPLSLKDPIHRVPKRQFRPSMKLTTLTKLDEVQVFEELATVYQEALA